MNPGIAKDGGAGGVWGGGGGGCERRSKGLPGNPPVANGAILKLAPLP
jgi:hypothetical protein